MILEITLKDNYFTKYLKDYLDRFNSHGYAVLLNILDYYKDDINEYRRIDKELREIGEEITKYDTISKRLTNKYIGYLRESIELFLEDFLDETDILYCANNLSIKPVKKVESKCHNKENIYWFVSYMGYIVM